MDSLNRLMAGRATVCGVVTSPPELSRVGEYKPSPSLARRIDELRAEIDADPNPNRTNEPHALLVSNPLGRILAWEELDYATVVALGERGARPPILTATVVALAGDGEGLLTQQRSTRCATYPGKRHLMGGRFHPGVDETLEDTVRRECDEEAELGLRLGRVPAAIVRENDTGFFQYAALGARASTSMGDSSWEGEVAPIPFERLAATLLDNSQWVPTGKLDILLWLAAGAPGATGATFGGDRDARALLEHVLGHSSGQFPDP